MILFINREWAIGIPNWATPPDEERHYESRWISLLTLRLDSTEAQLLVSLYLLGYWAGAAVTVVSDMTVEPGKD